MPLLVKAKGTAIGNRVQFSVLCVIHVNNNHRNYLPLHCMILFYQCAADLSRRMDHHLTSASIAKASRSELESCYRFTKFDDCEHDHSLMAGVLLCLFEYVPKTVPVVLMVPSYSIPKLVSTRLPCTPTTEDMSNTHTVNGLRVGSVVIMMLET